MIVAGIPGSRRHGNPAVEIWNETMTDLLKAALALAFVAAGLSAMTDTTEAQERRMERTVSVSATGSVSVTPDIAHISTGVVTEASTARAALADNSKAMRALIDALKVLGIASKDVQTKQIDVQPRYRNYKDGRAPAIEGYRVVNQVRIIARDIAKLGDILDKAVEVGANQIGGISFEVMDAEMLKDAARKAAMENAIRRANLYASAAGARVGRVLTISETVAGPIPRPVGYARAAMAESVPVEAGSQSLDVTVHVTWALE
jgi:uncharacterized protein YggE